MENTVFTASSLPRTYLRFALPVVLSMVVTMIYNLADTYFIASTNNTNLVAGVSLCAPIFTFLMALGNVFAQGGTSLVSRLLGRQDTHSVRHVSSFCVYASLINSILIEMIMLLFQKPVLSVLGTSKDTLTYAAQYYIPLTLGAPFIVTSFVYTNLLRAEGLSKESMIGTVSGAVINIILDPVFITVFGMGASGAAIATVLGYLCSDIYCFIIFKTKSRYLSVQPSELIIPIKHINQIFGIGIPAAISNLMHCLSVIFINQFLLPYGNVKIAAMGIVLKINSIVLLVLTGLAFGGQPLYGYFYGANDQERLTRLRRFCTIFISTVAIILTAIVYAASPYLLSCFIDNKQIIADGTVMLHFQVISAVFAGFVLLVTIMFQSAGKILVSFLLSISRQGIIFLTVLFIAANTAGYYGILASQSIADVITAIAAGILLRFVPFFKTIDSSSQNGYTIGE